MKIAFISCEDHGKHSVGYLDEESLLLDFLRKKGLDIGRCLWNDTSIDWKQYDIAILKSPWDYHEHIEQFYGWLDTLQSLNVPLLNSTEMVRWNCDKHYLKDIAEAGLKVISSFFLEKGSRPGLADYFERIETDTLIIKPCISAGGRNVFSINRDNIHQQQEKIWQLLRDESYIMQPFMKEIAEGEWSFIFLNNVFSHSILKLPADDDYRTQHYYGGITTAAEASEVQIESAAAYVRQFAKGALYVRVDGIMKEGQFYLMELELVEPYLYLETNPLGYENFYRALGGIVKNETEVNQAFWGSMVFRN